jgi:hypothetical protein
VSLERTGFIELPRGEQPGFDHADTWLGDGGARMYVAHTGADRVEVIDCEAKAFLRSIDDLTGVAGVLIDQAHDLLFTSDRACARVSVFRCSDEALLGRVDVGPHPNGLAYDRSRRRLYSFNLGEPLGVDCTTSVVDIDSMTVVAEIPLPGRPRWASYEPASDLIHANILDPAVVVRIDSGAGAIRGAIEVSVAGPHGYGSKVAACTAQPMAERSSSSNATPVTSRPRCRSPASRMLSGMTRWPTTSTWP